MACPSGPDGDGNNTRDNLANSINALDYDSRRTDIFVGVDVFGRGCLGGGGFQCDQPLRHGCIFLRKPKQDLVNNESILAIFSLELCNFLQNFL